MSWAQSHHTIDRLEERGVERRSARRSSLKGRERAIVSQTNIGIVSNATLGETSERRGGAHMGFSERIDTILNWTYYCSSRRADHQCTSQRQFGQWETAWNKHFGQFRVICVFMIITTMGIDNRGQRLSIQSERYRPKHWTVWNTILKRSGGGHNAVYNNWLFTAAQVGPEPVKSFAPNTKNHLRSFQQDSMIQSIKCRQGKHQSKFVISLCKQAIQDTQNSSSSTVILSVSWLTN